MEGERLERLPSNLEFIMNEMGGIESDNFEVNEKIEKEEKNENSEEKNQYFMQQLVDLKLELAKVRGKLDLQTVKYRRVKLELKVAQPQIYRKVMDEFRDKKLIQNSKKTRNSEKSKNLQKTEQLQNFLRNSIKKKHFQKGSLNNLKTRRKINTILGNTTRALTKAKHRAEKNPEATSKIRVDENNYDYLNLKQDAKLVKLVEKEVGVKLGNDIFSDNVTRVGSAMVRKMRLLLIVGT